MNYKDISICLGLALIFTTANLNAAQNSNNLKQVQSSDLTNQNNTNSDQDDSSDTTSSQSNDDDQNQNQNTDNNVVVQGA